MESLLEALGVRHEKQDVVNRALVLNAVWRNVDDATDWKSLEDRSKFMRLYLNVLYEKRDRMPEHLAAAIEKLEMTDEARKIIKGLLELDY